MLPASEMFNVRRLAGGGWQLLRGAGVVGAPIEGHHLSVMKLATNTVPQR